jgi:hypothetical protein
MCGLAMLVFGIIAFVKGEFKLTRNRVVRRGPAYAIGALLVLPLPLSFGIGFIYGIMAGARHEQVDVKQLQAKLAPVEVGLDVVCLLAALIIAAVTAQPVVRQRPTLAGDEYEPDVLRPEEDDLRRP